MRNQKSKHISGFTLLEVLLLLVIIGSIITLGVATYQRSATVARNDKTAAQMQQILNAAMAYYIANGAWPTAGTSTVIKCLQEDSTRTECSQQYLPKYLVSGWMRTYEAYSSGANFYVVTQIIADGADAHAAIIAGKLPMGYITSATTIPYPVQPCSSGVCGVVASVTIPGQNLSNSTAMNFAGLYHQGACVPVPSCPIDPSTGRATVPQIMLAPVQVTGTYDGFNQTYAYPITSFTAYARGGNNSSPGNCDGSPTMTPNCNDATQRSGNIPPSNKYWRACMKLITERGDVQNTLSGSANTAWGRRSTMAAFTRCAVVNEPSGSRFNVYGN